MTRIAFISDLHFDHNPNLLQTITQRLDKLKPDIFIIGGDLYSGTSRLSVLTKELKKYVPKLLIVPGNHDLWSVETNGTISSVHIFNRIFQRIVNFSGGIALGLTPYYYKNFAIVGCTGWYEDYPEPPMVSADQKMCVFPKMNTPEKVLTWQLSLLEQQLQEASTKTNRIIVVTHTLPFPSLIKQHIEPKLYKTMGSDKIGQLILKYPEVSLIFSGHLHQIHSIDVSSKHIPWIISPFGYPSEIADTQNLTLEKSLKLIEF